MPNPIQNPWVGFFKEASPLLTYVSRHISAKQQSWTDPSEILCVVVCEMAPFASVQTLK